MLKILTVFLALIAAVTLSAGCTGKSHTLTYNALSWEEVKNAEGYRIYDGDTVIGETTDTAFLLREDAGQHNIRLVSYKGDKDKEICNFSYSVPALSEKAYTCAAEFEEEQTSEQSYFSAVQHLKIDYTGSEKTTDSFSKVINLASNVRKVSIISDRRITVRASFVIQKRTEDIEFELENVVLHGLQTQQYAISYDGGYQASSGCLILKLFGIYNSVLSGYIAPKGEDGERSGWFKHGETGGAGVLLCLFLRSAVGHVVIAAHIRLFGYDLNEIAARSFGNVFRHMLCVLRARPREVDHESVAVGIARRVGRLRFRRVVARVFIVAVGLGTVLSVVARLFVARLRIVIGGRIGAGGKRKHGHAQYKAQKNN